MNNRVLILAALFFAFNISAFSNPEPIKLHPLNNRYFEWRGNPMVLVTSAEHYGAILNADADHIAYLDELQSKGLNMTRVFTGLYIEDEDFWCPNNTLSPAPGRLMTPWARSATPGCNGGGNKFDLSQWDSSYFNRLKSFLTEAATRGIIVEITLFCPLFNGAFLFAPFNSDNNINGIHYPQSEFFNPGNASAMNFAYSMVDKFVAELENFDNFWYQVCNEPYISGPFEVSEEWQVNITNRIVQQESNFTYKHLIARNICSTCPTISAIPNISIYTVHYGNYTQAQNNQGLNKVLSLDEDWDFPWYDDYAVRSYGWKWIMAGGGVYNHLDPSFQNGHWSGNGTELAIQWGRTSWGSASVRAQLGYCRAFINSLPFIFMTPNSSCIVSVPGGGNALALAQDGQAYGVYIYGGSTGNLTLNLPASSGYTAIWMSTTSGEVLSSESFSHNGGNTTLASPSFSGDIALKVLLTAALPVQLASFTGTPVQNGVRLDWRTISEVNNYGFYVHRKRMEEMEWHELPNSFVAGRGTTGEPQNYSFTDSSAPPVSLMYRLKQVDLDGTSILTEPIHISGPTQIAESNAAPGSFSLDQNYPNPFNPSTTITYQLPAVSHVTLQILDMLGRQIVTLVDGVEEPGHKSVQFDASGLASAVYLYRLQAGDFTKVRKLVIVK